MKVCAHKDFQAQVSVGRLTEKPPEGVDLDEMDPHSFIAEVQVHCTECGEPFGFKGVGNGFDLDRPTQSMDGLKATLPLRTPSEMAMAGPLASLDLESRQVARGARLQVRLDKEGEEPAVMDAVRQRTNGWLAAYKEAIANGLDDANAQMHADWKMKEEFGG